MRSKESINMGFEIIKQKIIEQGWNLDVINFGDKIDKNKYDIIGFNIFYITHQMNLIPFLKENYIEPLVDKRKEKPLLIAGGQGIINPLPLSEFIDVFNLGEGDINIKNILKAYENNNMNYIKNLKGIYGKNYNDNITFAHEKEVDSKPVIFNNRSMIELTRGCKYKCKFCQYGWTSGKHKEKDIELVKNQIDYIKNNDINSINFLSCNIGSYSKIEELLDYCIKNKIRLLNTDIRVDEYPQIAYLLNDLKTRTLKVGLESFCEKTRKAIGKNITDEQVEIFIDTALQNNISNLHFYLIYGLPFEDDYNKWFDYIRYTRDKIKHIERKIRLEFSIMNFEPFPYTPLKNAGLIDFNKKEDFLKDYLKVLEEVGVIQDASKKWYKNMRGRLGRKEEPYRITMWLLHGGKEVSDILLNLNIKGVNRSIKTSLYDKLKKEGANL